MNRNVFTFVLLILLAFSEIIIAQNSVIRLSGKIIDSETGEVLPSANIYVSSLKVAGTTDQNGYFSISISTPYPDSLLLKISYVGYFPKIIKIPSNAYAQNIIVELQNEITNLQAVTISARKVETVIANEKISTYKLSGSILNKISNVGEKDIIRSFQLLPGISSSNQSSSGLYIRGGTPDQNLTLFDGFTVYYVDHLHGFFSSFNPSVVKEAEVSKGGFSALYGNRVSGLVNIVSKDGNNKAFNVESNIGLLSANLLFEGPLGKKITFVAAGRKSWKSPLFDKIFGTVYDASKVQQNGILAQFKNAAIIESSFYDLNAKITYYPNLKNKIAFSIYNGIDDTNNTINSVVPVFGGVNVISADSINWGNLGFSIKWAKRFNESISINTAINYSNYYSNRKNVVQTDLAVRDGTKQTVRYGTLENNNLREISLTSSIHVLTARNNTFDIGIDINKFYTKFNYIQNDSISVLSNDNKGILGTFYIQNNLKLFQDKTLLIGGLRVNYYNTNNFACFEPRFSVNHSLSNYIKVKASFGLFKQFIKQVDRDDVSSRGFWILSGNESIAPTSSIHSILGVSFEKNGYLIDVEAYHKDLWNETRFSLVNISQTIFNSSTIATFYQGSSVSKGIDFLLQKKAGIFTGWIGYTIGKSEKNVQDFVPYIFPSNTDVRHEFKSTILFNLDRWNFSLSWLYATGKPFTNIIGGYGLKFPDETSQFYSNTTSYNGFRYPNSQRLDASVSYTMKYGSINISVFNVLNSSNVWYYKFNVVNKVDKQGLVLESSLLNTEINYLGITPSISLSFNLK